MPSFKCSYSQAIPVIKVLISVGKETILEAGVKFKESVIKEKQIYWEIRKGPINYHRKQERDLNDQPG
jgi:hypothetical protein